MSLNSLNEIAEYIVSDGKGILAADESTGTIKKRFDTIDTESNENNRRTYREMLFQSEGMKDNIGGVILFDETIKQNAADGSSLVSIITIELFKSYSKMASEAAHINAATADFISTAPRPNILPDLISPEKAPYFHCFGSPG